MGKGMWMLVHERITTLFSSSLHLDTGRTSEVGDDFFFRSHVPGQSRRSLGLQLAHTHYCNHLMRVGVAGLDRTEQTGGRVGLVIGFDTYLPTR